MIAVYLALFLVTVVLYMRKQYLPYLLCYFGLMTKLFMLDTSEEISIKGEDLCIVVNFLLLPVVWKRNREVFAWRDDSITKWIYIYMLFYVAEYLVTTLLGWESPLNGLKVIRVSFLMWGYFIFRSIPYKIFEQFFSVALRITLLQAFLYFLQFLGINLLADNTLNTERTEEAGINFAWNIPTLTIFFLYFTLKANYPQKAKLILVPLFLCMILLTFVRGIIISVIIGLAYYIYKQGDKTKLIPITVGFLVVVVLSLSFMGRKTDSSAGNSITEQFVEIVQDPANLADNYNSGSGTFTFRMAMLMERVFYLIENPKYLMTGVGTMHEESPSTLDQFDFLLGTINEDSYSGKGIIECSDITWVPIVLRYGLIGTVLHFMMFVVIIRKARNRKDVLFVLAPFYLGAFILSFDGSFFENPIQLFLLSLFLSLVSNTKQISTE